MTTRLEGLATELDSLLVDLESVETEHADAIADVAEVHRRGAVNLLHYAALRRHDRRDLQHDLMDIGVTSLATTEPNVRAKVQAARNLLRALTGASGPWPLDEIGDVLDEGDRLLAANADAVFGPARPGRHTRIMVTLPTEAADDPALVHALVEAGMDVARINCAHDDPAVWARMTAQVRVAAIASGRDVLVSMDLPGPKLRTGPIVAGPRVGRARVTRLESGEVLAPATIWFTSNLDPTPAPATVPPARRPALAVHVDPVWLALLAVGDEVKVRDARGRRRSFLVTESGLAGALSEGSRSTYLEEGAVVRNGRHRTRAGGFAPIARKITVRVNDQLVLTSDLTAVDLPRPGAVARIGCTLPDAVAALRPGDRVLFDDGVIAAAVVSTQPGEATLRISRTKPGGQHLGAEKGINLPDTVLPVPALTTDDESHLPFIAEHADMVAMSFVRTPSDVIRLLASLDRAAGADLGIVVKIETREGFENLPAILLAAMRHPRIAVMVARGDLAVEIGFERLAEVPRQILALCEAAHVPSIWATQVLDGLARTGQASRAEITDAAAGQRADCVMLNKGPHIVDAIRGLDDILVRMGQVQTRSRTLMRHIHSWDVHAPSTDLEEPS